jgi:phage FluMu protein Com
MPVVACVECNRSLVIPTNNAGRKFKCPRCNTAVTTSTENPPEARGLARTRVVPALAAMPPFNPPREMPPPDGEILPVRTLPRQPASSPMVSTHRPRRSFWIKVIGAYLALVAMGIGLVAFWLATRN